MHRYTILTALLCIGGLAPAAGKAAVSGRVVDYLARPVEGAEVAIYEEVHDISTDRDIARLRDEIRRTDADGWFTFATDVARSYRVFIVCRKAGLALGWDCLMHVADNVIVLERPCVMAGVLVDAGGHPVVGAKVRAVPKSSYLRRLEQSPILAPESWLTTETDRHGRFRFEEFAAEVSADFWVQAPARTLVYTYTPQRMTVCGFEAGRTDVRLVLPDEMVVRGEVVDVQTGRPIKGVSVIVHADMIDRDHANPYLPDRTISGEDGRFTFKGIPPGRHYMDISAPYETGLVDQRVRFEVRAGQDAAQIAAHLHTGGVIEIKASEETTNEPIGNLPVYFWEAVQDEQSSFYKYGQTGTDGMLRIRAPAGLCKFHTRLEGYFPLSHEDQASVTAGQTSRAQVVLWRPPEVSGLVLDESGRPLVGASVNDALTDQTGRFRVPLPAEDSPFCRWIVRHAGDNLAAIIAVERDDTPIQITLKPALVVSGRVTEPNGVGIPAARVALHARADEGLTPYGPEVVADSQGHYTMRAVVPGQSGFEYRISTHASGYGMRQYKRISIGDEPGAHVTLDPIVLRPADQSVTGVVVAVDGRPEAALPIAVHGDDQPARYAATDPNGCFIVTRVCKGPLRIQAGFSNVRDKTGILRAEGGDQDVRVVLGQDGVHLRYASLTGKALPGRDDLALGLSQADVEGKMLVLCFFDMQQRSSRNTMVELAKRAEEFGRKGIALAVIQVAKVDQADLDKWAADNRIGFPIRTIRADEQKMRTTWGIKSLPWLILADHTHIVRAEGLQLPELERQIQKMSDGERW